MSKDPNAIQHGGDHYKRKSIQPWDYIVANNIGFLEGNAIKYISRWREKNGIEDLKKAIHYIEKLIAVETERLIVPPTTSSSSPRKDPEPNYVCVHLVPFTKSDFPAIKGRRVRCISEPNSNAYPIKQPHNSTELENGVTVDGEFYTYMGLMMRFVFEDGSRCGRWIGKDEGQVVG